MFCLSAILHINSRQLHIEMVTLGLGHMIMSAVILLIKQVTDITSLQLKWPVSEYFQVKMNCFVTFLCMHLANTFIQSDLHCLQGIHLHFYQFLLSLRTKPMTLAL